MTEIIRRLPFYSRLSQSEIGFISERAAKKSYGAHQLIHGSKTSCLGFLYVINGSLRAYILSDEGREVTLFTVRSGEYCVLSAACVISQITFDTFIETETETDIFLHGPSAFSELATGNIYVECFMYKLMCDRFSSVMRSVQQMIFEPIGRRLASFLLDCGKKTVNITQQEVAVKLNTAREVVSRALRKMENEGIVKLSRGKITVVDREALKNF